MLEITEYLSLPGPTKPAPDLGAVADTVWALGAGRFAGLGTIVDTAGDPVAVPRGVLASDPTPPWPSWPGGRSLSWPQERRGLAFSRLKVDAIGGLKMRAGGDASTGAGRRA